MAVNRVDFGGKTLIDLTGDTLELPEQLLKGILAHAKDGTQIEGTLEAGGGGGGGVSTLWGGKITTGSFVLAEEKTSEYIIATSSDEGMLGLLNDGESITTQEVYSSIGLLVVRKPTGSFDPYSYAKCVGASMYIPMAFGSGSSSSTMTQYWDLYGSPRTTTTIVATVSYDRLSIKFNTSYKGSPDFTYQWLAWRGVI